MMEVFASITIGHVPLSVLLFMKKIKVLLFLSIYVHKLPYFSVPINCILAACRFVAYACLPFSLTKGTWQWRRTAPSNLEPKQTNAWLNAS